MGLGPKVFCTYCKSENHYRGQCPKEARDAEKKAEEKASGQRGSSTSPATGSKAETESESKGCYLCPECFQEHRNPKVYKCRNKKCNFVITEECRKRWLKEEKDDKAAAEATKPAEQSPAAEGLIAFTGAAARLQGVVERNLDQGLHTDQTLWSEADIKRDKERKRLEKHLKECEEEGLEELAKEAEAALKKLPKPEAAKGIKVQVDAHRTLVDKQERYEKEATKLEQRKVELKRELETMDETFQAREEELLKEEKEKREERQRKFAVLKADKQKALVETMEKQEELDTSYTAFRAKAGSAMDGAKALYPGLVPGMAQPLQAEALTEHLRTTYQGPMVDAAAMAQIVAAVIKFQAEASGAPVEGGSKDRLVAATRERIEKNVKFEDEKAEAAKKAAKQKEEEKERKKEEEKKKKQQQQQPQQPQQQQQQPQQQQEAPEREPAPKNAEALAAPAGERAPATKRGADSPEMGKGSGQAEAKESKVESKTDGSSE